jgi:hypothetical protein
MNGKLNEAALAAMRLQNGYALAIDTRDWDCFTMLPSILDLADRS